MLAAPGDRSGIDVATVQAHGGRAGDIGRRAAAAEVEHLGIVRERQAAPAQRPEQVDGQVAANVGEAALVAAAVHAHAQFGRRKRLRLGGRHPLPDRVRGPRVDTRPVLAQAERAVML